MQMNDETSDLSPGAPDHARSKRSLRGRSGCLNCRRRRKKCDERKPACAKCRRLGEACEWDPGITFRLSGLDARHPSMRAASKSSSQNEFQLVDVVFDAQTHQRKEFLNGREFDSLDSNIEGTSETAYGGASETSNRDINEPENLSRRRIYWSEEILEEGEGQQCSVSPTKPTSCSLQQQDDGLDTKLHEVICSAEPNLEYKQPRGSVRGSLQDPTPDPVYSASSDGVHTCSDTVQDIMPFTFPELETLDYLTEQGDASHRGYAESFWPSLGAEDIGSMVDADDVLGESPDVFAIYYPNATYRELHTTLYNHMVDTAKGTGLTRQGTPVAGLSPQLTDVPDPGIAHPVWHQTQSKHFALSNLLGGLTRRREMELWRNYLSEIALWLDMFDNDCHFQYHIPLLAQSSQHLRLSVLALSARQMERKDPNKPYTESLGLYQEAIKLIAHELESMDTAVIASCVLLCVLEMMSSSPRDWARHLEGCAMLIKAAGVNGVSGGMKQALFWCFARMDMWGGFLSDTNTKIPTSLWFLPTGSMSVAISRFKTDFRSFDSYANYSVFLCASVLNVVSNKQGITTPNDRVASYSARWKALFDLLEDWYSSRPLEMRPLDSSLPEIQPDEPFPIILYSNAAAASGNQLYHTATLLMLQAKPKDVKLRGQKSIFWHARQICGITASNSSHAAYTNALQPLWFAGKVMSSRSEHNVVLEMLDKIEKETGFATSWRAHDLKEYWGDEA